MFRRICLAAVIMSGFWGGGQYVEAASTDFGVAAQLPTNQIDKKLHYYDLLVTPGSTQDLKLKIQNTSTGTQRFEISTNRAGTTDDGQLNYNQHGATPPKSLAYNIESLMPKTRVVSIEPRTTRTVSLKLTAPTKNWSGILLGAIHVSKLDTTTRVAYNIGLQLRSTKNLPAQTAQLQFNGVSTKIRATGDTVSALIENPAPRIQNGLGLQAKVYRMKTGQKVMHRELSQATLAPNSVMSFIINKTSKQLASGKYKLIVDAKNGTQNWHFTKQFTVIEPVIKSKTTTSASPQKLHNVPTSLIAILIAIMFALGAWIYWIIRKSQAHE